MASTRKPRTPKDAPLRPQITDSEYQDLLAIRLGAMHGFEKGTVTAEQKNRARADVRNARKIRKNPEQAARNTAWNEYQAKLAAEKEAAAAARPKRVRKPATPTLTEVTAPEFTVTETENGGVQVTPVPGTGGVPVESAV